MPRSDTPPFRDYLDHVLLRHPYVKTQADLARETRISATAINNWYSRSSSPNQENLQIIADKLKLDAAWFRLPLMDFKEKIDAHFGGRRLLSVRARESDAINILIWDDNSKARPMGKFSQAKHGIVPESRLSLPEIPQQTRVSITIDLTLMNGALAADVLVFSEDGEETVCLRPSTLSLQALPLSTRVLEVPSPLPDNPQNMKLRTSKLGEMSVIAALIPKELADRAGYRSLRALLSEVENHHDCPHKLLLQTIEVLQAAEWRKRSMRVIP